MQDESQKEQKPPETSQTETPQSETFYQRLKRLSQSTQGGPKFVDSSNLGPIVIHRLGSFEPPADPSKK